MSWRRWKYALAVIGELVLPLIVYGLVILAAIIVWAQVVL